MQGKLYDRELVGRILDDSAYEIYTFDARTLKFLHVSQGALDNLGYTADELSQLTPLDLKPDFDLQSFQKMVEPLQLGDERQLRFETAHKRADGTLYPVEVLLQYSAAARDGAFVAAIHDITERKRIEEKFKASEARYAAAIKFS